MSKHKPEKQPLYGAIRAVMPGADIVEEIPTEVNLPKTTGRKHIPDDEKAISRAHSFRPAVLRALDRYAETMHLSASHVIVIALHNLIPKEFWEE